MNYGQSELSKNASLTKWSSELIAKSIKLLT